MATAELAGTLRSSEEAVALAGELRRLTRVATIIALLTSPAAYFFFHQEVGLGMGKALLATAAAVIGFRGLIDLIVRRLIPWPSLFGTEERRLREEDIVNRRRSWSWSFFYRLVARLGGGITLWYLVQLAKGDQGVTWWGTVGAFFDGIAKEGPKAGKYAPLLLLFFFYFIFNFLILLGPIMWMGISQIRGYEPGDA